MTCTVGLVHKGKVYLGADAYSSSGTSTAAAVMPKVWRSGPWVVGFAGSWRAAQILQHHVELPDPSFVGDQLPAFMVTKVVPAIRAGFIEHGVSAESGDPVAGWPILLGVNGTLWMMDLDWAIHQVHDDYMAIGCGNDLALGSLHSTPGLGPRRRVRLALEAAAHHSSAVCGPFAQVAA